MMVEITITKFEKIEQIFKLDVLLKLMEEMKDEERLLQDE
jgi:hypothetical protein